MTAAAPAPIVDAAEVRQLLAAIGHAWRPDVPDPAARLARAPALLADLRRLVADQYAGRAINPALLRRPLGHGLDLATLVDEGGLALGSAFLFGAELLADPVAGAEVLRNWINFGSVHKQPDGRRERRLPPLANRFPQCPVCGRRQLHDESNCTHGVDPQRIDPRWVALIDEIEAEPHGTGRVPN